MQERAYVIERLQHFIGYSRVPISILVGMGFFLLSSPSFSSMILGVPFILFGEGLRIWSSGYLKKNKGIQTQGPYSLTRNPLYLGNFFIGFGFALMGNTLAGGVSLMGGLVVIYSATILEEERYLGLRFGEVYQSYFQSVPRFFPRFHRPESGGFQWAQVRAHREPNTWWGLLGGMLLFSLKVWLG